jgi:hypothetical protein
MPYRHIPPDNRTRAHNLFVGTPYRGMSRHCTVGTYIAHVVRCFDHQSVSRNVFFERLCEVESWVQYELAGEGFVIPLETPFI